MARDNPNKHGRPQDARHFEGQIRGRMVVRNRALVVMFGFPVTVLRSKPRAANPARELNACPRGAALVRFARLFPTQLCIDVVGGVGGGGVNLAWVCLWQRQFVTPRCSCSRCCCC